MTSLFLIYLLIINAVSFLLMLEDKRRARKNLWRIRESTLLLTAALGGSLGALAGMYLARHKTRHRKFTLGIPLILAAQIAIVLWVLWNIPECKIFIGTPLPSTLRPR